MERTYGLKIGGGFITDILNPLPDQLDLAAIDDRLRNTRRFTNNPAALTVWQHVHLVQMLCDALLTHPAELHQQVRTWCRHHDDHEGVLGDIPGPFKSLISKHTHVVDAVEVGMDQAICMARGIPVPTTEVRRIVHHYDKMAETLEWVFVLGEELQPWSYPVEEGLSGEWIAGALADVRML